MTEQTPLHSLHKKLGAKMVDFAGWEMPVQYSGIKEEHLVVRKKAGLFDVSHMGEIEIYGQGALTLVQRLTCNDASRLESGRSQYSALLTEQGTFVDDIMVYRRAEDHFLLCVNASNTLKDFEWILSHRQPDVTIENRSNAWGLIALQGPLARQILSSSLKKTFFEETKLYGASVLLSATGYTGEDGFEIFCPASDAEKIWTEILERGKPLGLLPCGLGARDTLRLEAAYPLYGHEIDDKTTPWEAGLDWIVKMQKGDFIGRTALKEPRNDKKPVGLKMIESGIPRQGYPVLLEDQEVGRITSGTFSPLLEIGIALASVTCCLTKEELVGKRVRITIREKSRTAEIVRLPLHKQGVK
ncbi:MAG: glycine cleavage system aminomethyltransferase GcvT [Deltaproteobacteria bacterium]|nr:glycine cleavage system aminomethyltransferase GcvT [Deltaproteobacteria bacterium]